MNKIETEKGYGLKSDNLKFDFEGAEGGIFAVYHDDDDNMMLFTYQQAKDFARFVNFIKRKEIK